MFLLNSENNFKNTKESIFLKLRGDDLSFKKIQNKKKFKLF